MQYIELHDRIDQTGIERIFGATPSQLPRLSATAQQILRAEGLLGLEQQGHILVDTGLKQKDPDLEQTRRTLSTPEAVVRAQLHSWDSRLGPRPSSGAILGVCPRRSHRAASGQH